jgi:hypothetical protein
MLKSFRTKTYRNLPTVDDHKAGSAGSPSNDTRSSSVGLCDDDVDDCRKLFPFAPPFQSKETKLFASSCAREKRKKKERNRISIRRCASLSAGLGPFDPKLPSQDVVVLLIYLFDLCFCFFFNLKRKGEILFSWWLSSGAVLPGSYST